MRKRNLSSLMIMAASKDTRSDVDNTVMMGADAKSVAWRHAHLVVAVLTVQELPMKACDVASQ